MLATTFSSSSIARSVRRSSALSEDEIRRAAPSVFAQAPHDSRSTRYTYIPTIDILRGLFSNGFRPFFAVQASARTEDKRGYTKHMLRLRHEDQIARAGEDVNEVILINSHDGASSYQMLAGCFRFVCANGLVAGNTQADIRVKHSGNALDEVLDGACSIMKSFEDVDATKDAFKSTELTSAEQVVFARAALAIRYDSTEKEPPIEAAQVLAARRWEDQGNSLWTTFQRAQENLVQGGVRTADRRRRTRTRAVRGIDGNVALNRGLWVLAEEMRKLRTAAA
jgi:hypothetical protein